MSSESANKKDIVAYARTVSILWNAVTVLREGAVLDNVLTLDNSFSLSLTGLKFGVNSVNAVPSATQTGTCSFEKFFTVKAFCKPWLENSQSSFLHSTQFIPIRSFTYLCWNSLNNARFSSQMLFWRWPLAPCTVYFNNPIGILLEFCWNILNLVTCFTEFWGFNLHSV